MRYPKIDLEGAVAAVTGGARGTGKATSDLLAANGATVCIGDLEGADGPNGYAVDVTSRESFAEFMGAVLDRFGRIDILVNNAGVMPLGDFLSEADAISATTLDVNVWGLIHGMRLVLPNMIERGSGHVVNVSSMAGKLVVPGLAVYNASKFAAVGLSAAVREEYRHTGVSVTAVLPSAGAHPTRVRCTTWPWDAHRRGRRRRAGDRRQRGHSACRDHRAPLSGGMGSAERCGTGARDATGPQADR